MKLDGAEFAKAAIIVSALMLFFGIGNYIATVSLVTPAMEKDAAPWAALWVILAIVGLICLPISILRFRKLRTSLRTFHEEITLAGPSDTKQLAHLTCDVRDWAGQSIRHTECSIRLLSDDFDISGIDTDFFGAFCKVREQLASRHFYPLCYGASRNVHPSGMGRDMALGLVAYMLQIGKPAQDTVQIFEAGPDIELSTVADQRAFWEEWLYAKTGRRVAPRKS